MFQLGLAYVIQAEREREIAERVRQQRLLRQEPDAPATRDASVRRDCDERSAPVRARVLGS
jgi:hypothetical protein